MLACSGKEGAMRMSLIVIVAMTALACAGDPADLVLPSDVSAIEKDEDFVKAIKTLSEEDRELLAGYLMRRELGKAFGGAKDGMPVTVGEAIADQKAWAEQRAKDEAEAKALAEKVQAELEAKQRELREAVTVALTSKSVLGKNFRAGRYSDAIAVSIAFQNKTDKAVGGVKGVMVFSDMFDEEIKRVNVSYDEGIEPKSTSTWKAELGHNQFMPADTKLMNTEFEKLKTRWEPEVILFTDGTSLKVQ